jgi:hypothetical protein
MFRYDPVATLAGVEAPIVAVSAAASTDDQPGERRRALAAVDAARFASGRHSISTVSFPHDGHNLMRYRPDAVSAAILSVSATAAKP